MKEQLKIIRTLAELEALKAYIADKDFIAFDTETNGVEKTSEIIGYSICAEVDPAIGYYVITAYWDVAESSLKYLETAQASKEFFALLVGKNLIMQYAIFDCSMVRNNYGIDLMPHVHTDTLLLGHLLNENRPNGLKERGVELFGEDARAEQAEMKASVSKNGGVLTKALYELYKADAELIARYGAKDAILTLRVFYHDVPVLFEEGLDKFFYDEETMPLLRGPTYDLNTTGLKVDPERLQKLRRELEAEILDAKGYIHGEIKEYVQDKYPGTGKTNHFNIGASQQLAWLLFYRLENPFNTLTDGGKEVCKFFGLKLPYSLQAKREFIQVCLDNKDRVYAESGFNPKTGKKTLPKKIGDPWKYMACGKESLGKLAQKYKWVERLLEYAKALKLLNTYVCGIEEGVKYGIIRPSFLQHGTTSGRYSSRRPNFQNLPRDDKRVKNCIVARPGKVFVGADHSQLEPRTFASISQDPTLMGCFASGQDFYSVVGAPIFDAYDATLIKDDSPNSFPVKYKVLRDVSKIIALAAPYGTTAFQMSGEIARKAKLTKSPEECQGIIDRYFESYPNVQLMMLDSHEQAKTNGVVYSLFGRPRRIPAAKEIREIYGNTQHGDLPYPIRTLLNLGMNHRVQSTAASVMNRNTIRIKANIDLLAQEDPRWLEVKLVLQVHDELVLEGPEALVEDMALILKDGMENAVALPGVALQAEPKSGYSLAELK